METWYSFRIANLFFETFWIDSDKKISTKIFRPCHFFTILAILAKKQSPTKKKNYTGKNFRFRDFQFKIRLKTFWIDSDQKKFRPKFFELIIFHYFDHFGRKKQSPTKKFFTGKKFPFWYFGLKYVLKHSKSIPTKKIFDQNFLSLSFFHYFGHFGRKNRVPRKKFHMGKIFFFEIFDLKYVSNHSESIPTKTRARWLSFSSTEF